MTRTCTRCHNSYRITEFPFVGRGGDRSPDAPRNTMCRKCLDAVNRVLHNEMDKERKKAKRRRRANIHVPHLGHDAKPPDEMEIIAAEEIARDDVLQWEPTLQDLIQWRKDHPPRLRHQKDRKGSEVQEQHPSDTRFLSEMSKRAGRLVGEEDETKGDRHGLRI